MLKQISTLNVLGHFSTIIHFRLIVPLKIAAFCYANSMDPTVRLGAMAEDLVPMCMHDKCTYIYQRA
jgi:hypothetical protein